MAAATALPEQHKIRRQGLPEALAESLRERILNGEFKEGEALAQETLATEYDVSRMPVREALRQLEAEGLVELKLHKGAVVTSVPAGQIAELFDLRATLECDVLAHALPRITEADLELSRGVLAKLETAYRDRDIGRWGALNWQFHRSLYLPAERVQTLAILQGINVQTDRYVRLQLLLTDAVADAEAEHREIMRLCEARDGDRAIPYLRRHILDAGSDLLAAMAKSRHAAAS